MSLPAARSWASTLCTSRSVPPAVCSILFSPISTQTPVISSNSQSQVTAPRPPGLVPSLPSVPSPVLACVLAVLRMLLPLPPTLLVARVVAVVAVCRVWVYAFRSYCDFIRGWTGGYLHDLPVTVDGINAKNGLLLPGLQFFHTLEKFPARFWLLNTWYSIVLQLTKSE